MQSLTLRIAAVPSLSVLTGVVRNSVGPIVGGLAVVLIAATLASDGTRATASSMTMVAVRNSVAGDFAGFDATGLPVYRLPSISVSVDRKTALARTAREAMQAHANKLRARNDVGSESTLATKERGVGVEFRMSFTKSTPTPM